MEITKEPRQLRCRICNGDIFQASGKANWKYCQQCDTYVCPRCHRNDLKNAPTCTEHDPAGQWVTSVADAGKAVLFR